MTEDSIEVNNRKELIHLHQLFDNPSNRNLFPDAIHSIDDISQLNLVDDIHHHHPQDSHRFEIGELQVISADIFLMRHSNKTTYDMLTIVH